VDGSNHGARLKPTRSPSLHREFLRYVDSSSPASRDGERARDRTAAGGEYFTAVQNEARRARYRVHAQFDDAWELGVPHEASPSAHHRRAQRPCLVISCPTQTRAPAPNRALGLCAAIGDLPILRAEGAKMNATTTSTDVRNICTTAADTARNYLFKVLETDRANEADESRRASTQRTRPS
jgi:hypothetical protein